MKKILPFFLFFILCLQEVSASVLIIAILPNPIGDDALGEYIELQNLTCNLIDISSFTLADASGKTYSIPEWKSIAPWEILRFYYNETKITLNNSWEETITLRDNGGNILDSFSYSWTQKEDDILRLRTQSVLCTYPEDTTWASSESGTTVSNSWSYSLDWWYFWTWENSSWSLHEVVNNGALFSWSESWGNSWSILFDTGIFLSQSGAMWSDTWSVSTWSLNSGTIIQDDPLPDPTWWNLIPEWLYYDDVDQNGKIDTLEIHYNFLLTGSVDISSILIYSQTGGLSTAKIDTATWYIVSWSLSGNVLILWLREWDIEKSILSMSNGTSSDLRLKSINSLWIVSLDGKKWENLTLTTSFENYKNVLRKWQWYTLAPFPENSGSWWIMASWSADTVFSINEFWEILPTLQSPTNALFSSWIFTCTQLDCKINITLEPLFQSGISQKNYTCFFGTGWELVPDNDCNPNTYYFLSSWVISLRILSMGNDRERILYFPVVFSIQRIGDDLGNEDPKNREIDNGKPVAVITMDGKWKEYYETIGDYELNCYTLTCSLNFSAEKSYDPEWSSIRYLWIYGPNEIKTSKDPGTIRYSLWDHRLTLRVIDLDENYDEIVYKIHVLWAKQKAPIQKNEKVTLKKTLNQVASQGIVVKKKFKKLKMEFFSPPQIVLQWKTWKKLWDGSYHCIIKTAKTCTLNFTLTGALSSFEYQWYLDGSPVSRGKNPPAWKFSTWKHTLELETFLKGSIIPIEKQSYAISVIRSPKKMKKSTRSSVKKPKSEKKYSLIPEAQASNGKNTSATADSLIIYGILIAWFWSGYLLRSRKKWNHSS